MMDFFERVNNRSKRNFALVGLLLAANQQYISPQYSPPDLQILNPTNGEVIRDWRNTRFKVRLGSNENYDTISFTVAKVDSEGSFKQIVWQKELNNSAGGDICVNGADTSGNCEPMAVMRMLPGGSFILLTSVVPADESGVVFGKTVGFEYLPNPNFLPLVFNR